jgi:hypothetical protein
MRRSAAAMAFPPVKYSTTRLGGGATAYGVTYPGGLDQTTPSLSLQPGALRDCLNYECSQTGGYGRIQGYERVDGRASPSDATYTIIQLSSFVTVPTVGNGVYQGMTGATGTIIAVNNVAGAYYIAVTNTTGAFSYTDVIFANSTAFTVTAANPQTITAANPLTVSDTIVGTATTPSTSLSAKLNAQYLAAAADVYRALIGPVPGSGSILGVVGMVFNGVDNLYAFRANSAGTQALLYKTTSTGWVQVPYFNTINFTAGNTATPLAGDTLTQGGVTAIVKRVMTRSGAWSGTAAGGLVITTSTGGSFGAGAATTSSGATLTLSGAPTAITFAPGGHFQFAKGNFSGQLSTRRIYGCDGVNQCFEFDGETVAPITTGLSPDVPSNIVCHQNFLIVSQASSIVYCEVGEPFKWANGGEIATGDTVTNLVTLPGAQTTAALAVYLRNNTAILYGADPSTFNFVTFNTGSGALPYSAQNLSDTYVFDDELGVVNLKTTLNYGNFASNTLTKNITPFILQERSKLTASALNRSKNQYRTFFSDGYGLWLTILNQQYLGAAVVQFPNPVFCCDEGESSAGTEVTYYGSSDGLGYVYQLDVGTSFDGADLNAYIVMAWDAIKSPRILKRFREASIEIQGDTYAEVQFGYKLGYGSTNIGQPNNTTYSTNFAAAPAWDSFTWDQFVWDGQTLSPTDVDMTGTAENVQVIITSGSNYMGSFNINSLVYHYSDRRGLR